MISYRSFALHIILGGESCCCSPQTPWHSGAGSCMRVDMNAAAPSSASPSSASLLANVAPAPRLVAEQLACRRGGRGVFAGLSFTLANGSALLLLGANGSGKSSLLRLLAGLLKPASGTLHWDGERIEGSELAGCAAYLGHLDAVKPTVPTLEGMRFWAKLAGHANPEAAALAALEQVELGHLAPLPGRLLSAGQKRRVALARLLLSRAPLWLLDEPTVALDHRAIGGLERALAEHRAKGGLVIASTHASFALPDAHTLHMDRYGDDNSDFDGLTAETPL
jgi:heme exporter protein A